METTTTAIITSISVKPCWRGERCSRRDIAPVRNETRFGGIVVIRGRGSHAIRHADAARNAVIDTFPPDGQRKVSKNGEIAGRATCRCGNEPPGTASSSGRAAPVGAGVEPPEQR